MAFNPFESFRKNGKAVFAILAIVCMFTFVLSSGMGGGGDFIDWIARQFGGRDSRNEALGEIAGHAYYAKDLNDLRRKRMAANAYMLQAVNVTDRRAYEEIVNSVKNKTIKDKLIASELEKAVAARNEIENALKSDDNQPLMMRQFKLQQAERQFDEAGFALYRIYQQMDPKDTSNDHTLVDKFIKVIAHEGAQRQRSRDGLFFSTLPNANDSDALLFSLYLAEANKLGIKFSPDDIEKLIHDETIVDLPKDDREKIESLVRKELKVSPDTVLETIGDEFRVQLMASILHGAHFNGKSSRPAAMTPYEFFEYYKDNFERVGFDVIDVPVDKFVSEVKETPTDKELGQFFDGHRRTEYDPARPSPGFKKPRKIKLEYVAVDSKLPQYQVNSPSVRGLDAASMVAAGLGAAGSGNMFAGGMTAAAPFMAESWLVWNNIDPLLKNLRSGPLFREYGHGSPFAVVRPGETYSNSPLPDAALAAQLAVMKNPLTDLTVALSAHRNLANLLETRDRARFGLQLAVGLGVNPVFPYKAIVAAAANAPALPTHLYFAQELAKQRMAAPDRFEFSLDANGTRPERLAAADLASLQKKLTELRDKVAPKPDFSNFDPRKKKEPPKIDVKLVAETNAEARKLIAEWIKARPGVLTGQSKTLDDKYTIPFDPGLKALLESVKNIPLPHTVFDRDFFNLPFGIPELTKESAEALLYQPVVFPNQQMPSPSLFNEPVYLSWRIEDEIARAYTKLDEVPPDMMAQVVRAWKFQKARALAKAAADKLAGDIGALAKTQLLDADNKLAFDKGLADLAAASKYQLLGQRITLAQLQPAPNRPDMPKFSATPQYVPMSIENNREIPYPGAVMAEQLLDVRNKPLGEVVVTPDQPESNYYVCVMVDKEIPNEIRFYDTVFKTINPGRDSKTPPDPLYNQRAEQKAAFEFNRDAMDRLKAEEKFKETEALKKGLEKPGE